MFTPDLIIEQTGLEEASLGLSITLLDMPVVYQVSAPLFHDHTCDQLVFHLPSTFLLSQSGLSHIQNFEI